MNITFFISFVAVFLVIDCYTIRLTLINLRAPTNYLFPVVVTEEQMHWPVKDEDSDALRPVQSPKDDHPADTVIVDDFDRSYSKYHDTDLITATVI